MKSTELLILIFIFFATSCSTNNKQIDEKHSSKIDNSMNKLELKYSLQLIKSEDYKDIGNSRIGGVPDLATSIKYPEFELPENFSSNNYVGG